MANEGLRPYWYDSSVRSKEQFRLRFYYPKEISNITVLDRTSGYSTLVGVIKEGEGLYTRDINDGCLGRTGAFNRGNTVIYDHRQVKPVYSNRISKR